MAARLAKAHHTSFSKAMARLEIAMIPISSPEARGCSERQFRTHLTCCPKDWVV